MRRTTYKHQFVETLPDELEDGHLYVSIRYATATHKCFCGCGREVVTPLHPTKWQLRFDGLHVSLFPSVGSWSLPCQSHYWLESGRVEWAALWSRKKIQAARAKDASAEDEYWAKDHPERTSQKPAETVWGRLLHREWNDDEG